MPQPGLLAQVLMSLQRLVNALGMGCPSSYPFLIPILRLCTDPNQVSMCSANRPEGMYMLTRSFVKLRWSGRSDIRKFVVQPDELNLLEDGLQLWLITLRNAPAPQPELLDLFPNLASVMERSTGEQ